MSKRQGGKVPLKKARKRTCPATPSQTLSAQDNLEDQMLEESQKEAALGLYSQTPADPSGGWSSQPFYHDVPTLQITGVTPTQPPVGVSSSMEEEEHLLRRRNPLYPYSAPTVAAHTEPIPPPSTTVTYAPGVLEEAQARRAYMEQQIEAEEEEQQGTAPPTVAGGRKRPRSQLTQAMSDIFSRDLTPQEWAALQRAEQMIQAEQPRDPAPAPPGVRSIRYRALMKVLQDRMTHWKAIQAIQNNVRRLGYKVPRGTLYPAYPEFNLTTQQLQAANRIAGALLRH